MGPEVLPELPGALGVAGTAGAHGGLEDPGMAGGEFVGGFPDEVGDLAAGGQLPQHRVVHVGAQSQPVARAGQAGPGARGLIGLTVLQHMGQVVLDPRSAAAHRSAPSR
jgi:hypothetical protein